MKSYQASITCLKTNINYSVRLNCIKKIYIKVFNFIIDAIKSFFDPTSSIVITTT